jgi:hypothetical protein
MEVLLALIQFGAPLFLTGALWIAVQWLKRGPGKEFNVLWSLPGMFMIAVGAMLVMMGAVL